VSSTTACAFCLAKEVPERRTVIVHGLSVCDRCNTPELARRVRRARDWGVEVVEHQNPERRFEVTGWIVGSSPVRARFVIESPITAAKKLLVNELQVDERTFDDTVYISTRTRHETAALLRDRSARNAILDLLVDSDGTFDNEVVIDRGKVRARVHGTHPKLARRTLMSCCTILHALEGLSTSASRTRTPYR
jgi:hypothetical protein